MRARTSVRSPASLYALRPLASRRLPEGLTGINQFHQLLAECAAEPDEVIVGIETDRGLWVQALLAAGYQVYAINPLAATRYRDRHQVSGAKSDAGDAWAYCAINTSPAAALTTTNAATQATCTTKPYVHAATGSSASCTAAYDTKPATTNTPPGPTETKINKSLLTSYSPGMPNLIVIDGHAIRAGSSDHGPSTE